jgi:hypothetical protein
MAREWVRAGHEVHVLTGPGDRGGEYTPDLQRAAEQSGALVHRAPAPGIPKPERLLPAFSPECAGSVARPISRVRQILGQWKGFPDMQRSWIRPATRLGFGLFANRSFDVVWSTSPPESAHFVARGLASREVPWVADFRDQWSEYLLARWDPVSRWVIDRITRHVLAPASAITANTLGVAHSIERASGRSVECIANGFDPIEVVDTPVATRVLGYFGRVDPLMQRPDRLWPALRHLRERGTPWRVEFYAAPGGGGGAMIRVPSDLADLVQVMRPLPHPEALARMQAMTALLVLGWETRGGETSVAAKLYEYVGSGRPVVVCAPRDYEARTLVESKRLGLGAWGEGELVDVLRRIEAFEPSKESRESLSRAAMAARFLELFRQVAGSRTVLATH